MDGQPDGGAFDLQGVDQFAGDTVGIGHRDTAVQADDLHMRNGIQGPHHRGKAGR